MGPASGFWVFVALVLATWRWFALAGGLGLVAWLLLR